MAKKQHKFLCLVLCLALILTSVLMGTISAFATAGDTVYVRANNGWTNLHCYMWTDGAGNNGNWPGVKMTLVKDDIYSYKVTGSWNKIIFNVGPAPSLHPASGVRSHPRYGRSLPADLRP